MGRIKELEHKIHQQQARIDALEGQNERLFNERNELGEQRDNYRELLVRIRRCDHLDTAGWRREIDRVLSA